MTHENPVTAPQGGIAMSQRSTFSGRERQSLPYPQGTLRVSLVIPAYNESAVIARAVAEADTALASICPEYEIIVVDDGSTDDTAVVVEGLQVRYPHLRLLRHFHNRGYGAALASGFRAARFPWVAFTDADCQFDLRELASLLERCEEGVIVVGRRIGRKDPWLRRFLSWGYNQLVRGLLGIPVRDVDCALKVYPRALVRRLLPRSNGYFVNTEMLYRAVRQGWSIREVPVSHRPRAAGRSKVGLREVPRTAFTLLRFCWQQWRRRKPRRLASLPRPPVVWSGRLSVPAATSAPRPALPPASESGHPTALVVPPREAV